MATIITRAGKGSALSANEYDENVKQETNAQASNYTVTTADNRSTVEYTGTGSESITLPDASTLLAAEDTGDFQVTIKHGGTGTLTVAFNTGDTVDGVDTDILMQPNDCITLKCGSVTDDWMIINLSRLTTQGTADSAATQTSSEFTNIPSWVTQITVSIAALSTNGTSVPLIQIGDSGGYEVSGYAGSVVTSLVSGNSVSNVAANGFDLAPAWSAASVAQGSYTLTLLDSATNLWVINGGIGYSNTEAISTTRGYKALSGTLDRVRVIMTNSTDVFDGNTIININYRR